MTFNCQGKTQSLRTVFFTKYRSQTSQNPCNLRICFAITFHENLRVYCTNIIISAESSTSNLFHCEKNTIRYYQISEFLRWCMLKQCAPTVFKQYYRCRVIGSINVSLVREMNGKFIQSGFNIRLTSNEVPTSRASICIFLFMPSFQEISSVGKLIYSGPRWR